MPSFDPRAEQAATLEFHRQQQPPSCATDTPRNDRQELAAILLELQTNQGILDGLTRWYGLFVFTGGDVPTAQWNLAAMTSHLEHPLATDCLVASEIQHYRRSLQALGGLAQPSVGPRTLRCRYEMGHRFRAVASEIRLRTETLKSSLMKALEELPSRSE